MCIAAPTAPATVILVNEGAKALRETKHHTSTDHEPSFPFLASGLFLLCMTVLVVCLGFDSASSPQGLILQWVLSGVLARATVSTLRLKTSKAIMLPNTLTTHLASARSSPNTKVPKISRRILKVIHVLRPEKSLILPTTTDSGGHQIHKIYNTSAKIYENPL
jgi:hypothetical protein